MKNRINELRTAMGLTQEQVASKIGMTRQYVSELETGRRNIYNLQSQTIKKLSEALECNAEDLYYDFKKDFEFDLFNGKKRLIVDEVYLHWKNGLYVIEIGDMYFKVFDIDLKNVGMMGDKHFEDVIIPYEDDSIKLRKEKLTPVMPSFFMFYRIARRKPISEKRAMTHEEIEDFKQKYQPISVTDKFYIKSNISLDEGWYIQMKIYNDPMENDDSTIQVEREYRKKGISILAISPCAVQIRVE